MTWEIAVAIISAVAAVCGIVYGSKGSKRADVQQTKDDAMALARVEGKIDNISRGFEDMRVEARVQRGQIEDINTRLIRVEERCDMVTKHATLNGKAVDNK